MSSSKEVQLEKLEQELQEFLQECSKQEFSDEQMRYICQPLTWYFRKKSLKRWVFFCLLPLLMIYLLWNYCDTCAWSASAVGRILLIKMLPYWNWTPIYYNRCLIERTDSTEKQVEKANSLGKYETLWENCALCEDLNAIPTASNVSYSLLETDYLERGLPVIVTDCGVELQLQNLLQLIQHKAPQLLTTEPCDVSTNLMLKQLFNLGLALEKIGNSFSTSAWFLQFRNCQQKSVKASRNYAAKPYFYPNHLEPYYSSWLLMAQNMRRPLEEIYVRGLIFVQQLSGHFEYQLEPKAPCNRQKNCANLRLRLSAGECLVFSTDLWILSYALQKSIPERTSIATLFEVDWER